MAGTACSCNSLPPNTSFIYLFMNMTLTVDYRTYSPLISSIPRIPPGHVSPHVSHSAVMGVISNSFSESDKRERWTFLAFRKSFLLLAIIFIGANISYNETFLSTYQEYLHIVHKHRYRIFGIVRIYLRMYKVICVICWMLLDEHVISIYPYPCSDLSQAICTVQYIFRG